MFTIANPIYDTFFKYLMQDEAAAVCLLSAVLEQEITLLECLPQERILDAKERTEVSVIRFDYRATIRQGDGTVKKVLIELQKVRHLVDVGRFRRYLGSNYATPDRMGETEVHLPIITIYLLGFKLDVRSAVIRVGDVYTDAMTRQPIAEIDAFIEALTHHAYFIQIPRLSNKQQTRLERVLGLFSQQWVVETRTRRILEIPDELRTTDNEALVNRLVLAVADSEVQASAIEEESFDKVVLAEFEKERAEGVAEGIQTGILETARKLKAIGVDREQIAQATGLSALEIEHL